MSYLAGRGPRHALPLENGPGEGRVGLACRMQLSHPRRCIMIPMVDSLVAAGTPTTLLSIGPDFVALALLFGAALVWVMRGVGGQAERPSPTAIEAPAPSALAA